MQAEVSLNTAATADIPQLTLAMREEERIACFALSIFLKGL